MAARKTTEADVLDITAFKQAIIELGVQLCTDIKEGKAKQPIETIKEISSLYNAIK